MALSNWTTRSLWRRSLAAFATLALVGCAPTYSVRQSSFVPLPTAPPPAPLSGRGALELGASFSTGASAPVSAGSPGLSTPLAQPEGGLSVRITDFLLLRAYGGFAPTAGATQVTGDVPAPEEPAWTGGIGPVFRLLGANDLVFADFSLSGGFAVIPSRLIISERPYCSDPSSSDCPPATTSENIQREVMPLFTVGADFGLRPAEWIQIRIGGTVRNQPTNEAVFSRTAFTPGSSVSAGPIGVVIHAGVQLDVTDELGIRADVQWPALNLALTYGPIITVGVQGRIGTPDREHPIGLSI